MINNVSLRQLAHLAIEDRDRLKALGLAREDDRPFLISYNQIGINVGSDANRLECNTDFRCIHRSITVEQHMVKCLTVYTNKCGGNDDIITITVTDYAELDSDELKQIIDVLESVDEIDRFKVEHKKNIIVLEDQVRSLTYRLDHIIQSILDLK